MDLTLILPLYNEEKNLKKNFSKIYEKLNELGSFEIIIAEDGSTDRTKIIAQNFAKLPNVQLISSKEKLGRGRAIKNALNFSNGKVIGYMDIDLAVPLSYLPEALKLILNGETMVIGSRYAKGSHTKRRIRRFIASKAYNVLLRVVFNSKVSDHQCGFKFWNAKFLKKEAKIVIDNHWFFDSEIIIRSQRLGITPVELPVKWTEQRSSKVKSSDISYFLLSILKLRFEH